jgi:hypothetical protein
MSKVNGRGAHTSRFSYGLYAIFSWRFVFVLTHRTAVGVDLGSDLFSFASWATLHGLSHVFYINACAECFLICKPTHPNGQVWSIKRVTRIARPKLGVRSIQPCC